MACPVAKTASFSASALSFPYLPSLGGGRGGDRGYNASYGQGRWPALTLS